MIKIVNCKFCKEKLRANGYYAMIDLKREHLKENHIEQFNKYLLNNQKINKLEEEIWKIKADFEKETWRKK